MLMNVGAAEALKAGDFQCFVFHDVDLVPEDDRSENDIYLSKKNLFYL